VLTVRLFPLSFGLGFMLTLLYYGLDHSNADNVQKREQFRHLCPHCGLGAHLAHGSALPLAVLDACSFAASGYPRPGVVLVVGGYILFYMVQTICNHLATSAWQYPIIADAQRAAGWAGVLLFFAAIALITLGAANLGVAMVAGLDGWKAQL